MTQRCGVGAASKIGARVASFAARRRAARCETCARWASCKRGVRGRERVRRARGRVAKVMAKYLRIRRPNVRMLRERSSERGSRVAGSRRRACVRVRVGYDNTVSYVNPVTFRSEMRFHSSVVWMNLTTSCQRSGGCRRASRLETNAIASCASSTEKSQFAS